MANSPLFASIKQILFYCGFWSPEINIKWKQYCFTFYCYFGEISLLSLIVGEFMQIKEELNAMNEDIKKFAFFVGCVVMAIVQRLCKRRNVIEYMRKMLMREEQMNMNAYLKIRDVHLNVTNDVFFLPKWYIRTILASMIAVGSYMVFLYVKDYINPCDEVTKGCVRILLIPTYSPVDINKHYGLAIIYQAVGILYSVLMMLCTDMIIFAFIIYTVSRIKILHYIIQNIDHYALEVSNDSKPEGDQYYAIIKLCVEEHQNIIRDFEKLNNAVKYIMLIDFLLHSLQIASFTVGTFGGKKHSNIEAFSSMCNCVSLLQLILLYWHSHVLTEESLRVADAIYQSPWYEVSSKNKRSLMIMMIRSGRPLTLTIGPIYEVKLEVFLKILKTVYTFISLFRGVS